MKDQKNLESKQFSAILSIFCTPAYKIFKHENFFAEIAKKINLLIGLFVLVILRK